MGSPKMAPRRAIKLPAAAAEPLEVGPPSEDPLGWWPTLDPVEAS